LTEFEIYLFKQFFAFSNNTKQLAAKIEKEEKQKKEQHPNWASLGKLAQEQAQQQPVAPPHFLNFFHFFFSSSLQAGPIRQIHPLPPNRHPHDLLHDPVALPPLLPEHQPPRRCPSPFPLHLLSISPQPLTPDCLARLEKLLAGAADTANSILRFRHNRGPKPPVFASSPPPLPRCPH
jgi:hypothetical protein